jgi:nitrogen fixation NifU-like protein
MTTGLYEEVVLEHARRPRNRGRLAAATHGAAADNPLCGDTIHLDLEVAEGGIRAVTFEGHACAIATASASLLTEHVRGRPVADAQQLLMRMEALCAGPEDASTAAGAALGELAVFAGVRRYPARVRCATLAWDALRRALAD